MHELKFLVLFSGNKLGDCMVTNSILAQFIQVRVSRFEILPYNILHAHKKLNSSKNLVPESPRK